MQSRQFHFSPPRKSKHEGGQLRQGQAVLRQAGPSRMALEQPDDTPYDQRLSKAHWGPRQMA